MARSVSEVTQNIKVSVVAEYQYDRSNPEAGQYLHVYRVTIENHQSHPVQLISRYWRIKDASGEAKIVEGQGVVGEQPVIQPGQHYQYTSWCPITTAIGVMDGYYTMLAKEDQSIFEAVIPAFRLDASFVNN